MIFLNLILLDALLTILSNLLKNIGSSIQNTIIPLVLGNRGFFYEPKRDRRNPNKKASTTDAPVFA